MKKCDVWPGVRTLRSFVMEPRTRPGRGTQATHPSAKGASSAGSSSAYWERGPEEAEVAFVERWSFSRDSSLPPPIRVLPTGLVGVLFSRPVGGEPWTAAVLGPAMRSVIVHTSELREQLHAWLQPGVARSLFRCPPDELAPEGVPLADVWGREANVFLGDLSAASSWLERRARIVARFAQRAEGEDPAASLARCAVRQIRRDRGRRSIRSVCDALGVHGRRLERVFETHLGVSPKRFARITRFRFAREALRGGTPAAEIALDLGYSDQAHMTREFRELAGVPPAKL